MTDSPDTPRAPNEPFDFDEAFRTHFGYVWNSLRRLGVRDADLEDLTHDVFVTVHRKRDHFDASRPLKPWLFGIAANTASDYRRKASHRRERIDDTVEAVDSSPRADDALEDRQRKELVTQAIGSVDDSRVAVFLMHDVDGLPMPDIAAALEIPLNTGYSRLRLAREEFAAAVKRLRARRGGGP